MMAMEGSGKPFTQTTCAQINGIPTTLMVAMETMVDAAVPMLVLEHITVLPFIAAVMFTVKMEDRQYVGSEDCMLEAL